MPKEQRAPDMVLLFSTIFLLLIGLLMVYSSSSAWAMYRFQDAFYFVKRQALFASVGLVCMYLLMKVHYSFWRTWARPILLICFILLVIVLIPGIGLVRGGASSWLGVGAFSIQPSEFMKIGMIFFLASLLTEGKQPITSFYRGLLPSLIYVLLAFGLIMLQPDLGTGAVMVMTCVTMIFVAGARIRHFFLLSMVGLVGFVFLIISAPYRLKRIVSFVDPWSDPLETGFQIIQSLYAVGPGGLIGMGLGESKQKYFYLPEPQTDFIFAIVAEELGFLGGAVVLFLFSFIFIRGIKIALTASTAYGSFLAIGIVAMIALQVMINIGVVIGLIPVTGITLPLLSYGGSSLTLMLGSIGILLNISMHRKW